MNNFPPQGFPTSPPPSGLAIYGDGSDGSVTVTSSTFTGGPITSGVLTRDAYFTTLTINSPYILKTGGFRIFCSVALVNNGTIDNSGNAGGNASAGTPGAAGAIVASGSLGGSGIGVVGTGSGNRPYSGGSGGGGGVIMIAALTLTNNGTISANGGKAGTGVVAASLGGGNWGNNCTADVTNSLGAGGGVGGTASAPGFSGTGGTGGTVSVPTASETGFRSLPFAAILRLITAPTTFIVGGAGGGSGAFACDASGNGAAGGSAGGGGGVVVLIYSSITLGTVTANGGAHSAKVTMGTGTGTDGADGNAGSVIKIQN